MMMVGITDGILFQKGRKPKMEQITIRIQKDELGETMSLSDDKDIMIQIRTDTLKKMMEAKNAVHHD